MNAWLYLLTIILNIVIALCEFNFPSTFFSIIITAILLLDYSKRCILRNGFFQPIIIFNIFSTFFFVIRPIYILSYSNLAEFFFFRCYFMQYGLSPTNQLPFATASLIGLIGIFFVNVAYMHVASFYPPKEYLKISFGPYKTVANRTVYAFVAVAFLFWLLFLYKALIVHEPLSMIYILWVYILTAVLPINILNNEKITYITFFSLVVSVVSLSLLGNRQIIISLLLCVLASYITIKEHDNINYKKIFRLIFFTGFLAILLVTWYGSIRRGTTFALNTIIDNLLSEFGMYDMLVIALDHKDKFNTPFLFGYNYLCFFNFIIPGTNIEFFDFRLVQIVYKGFLGGGVPISIVGSFYYNFGYSGVVVGCFLFGIFIAKFYFSNIRKKSAVGFIQNIIFLTFIYDITRVGDIGRELLNFIILLLLVRIAMVFIPQNIMYIRKL